MASTLALIAATGIVVARIVAGDYWLPCGNPVENSAYKDWCFVELNFNQYNSYQAGAKALNTITQAEVRSISYVGNSQASYWPCPAYAAD